MIDPTPETPAAVVRPAPPELEFQTPLCSICLEATEFNEGFDCPNCGAHWAEQGNEPGEWDDPEAVQCTSVIAPWRGSKEYARLADYEYRCFLAEDHDPKRKHLHPEWSSGWLDTDKGAYRIETAPEATNV